MSLKHVFALIIVTVALPGLAFAGDEKAADACAEKLDANAMLIYRATKPGMPPKGELRELIRSHTVDLVVTHKIERDNARPAAQAAGACLALLMP
jgi:hypothetical protein